MLLHDESQGAFLWLAVDLNIKFTAMKDQLKMYQQAIEQLEKVQLKAVELEVKRMKIATFGICVGLLATAFFLLF